MKAIPDSILQQAKEFYEQGNSFRATAAKFGYSSTGLADALKNYGIVNRGIVNSDGQTYTRKYTLDETVFENIDTEEKAYWLGYLYADGYNNEDRKEVAFGQAEQDKESVEKFKDFLKSESPITVRMPQIHDKLMCQPFFRICVSSEKLSKDLVKWGCMQKKTFKLTFPDIELSLKHHFIRGYFDGDGSVTCADNLKTCGWNMLGTLDLLQKTQNLLPISNTKISEYKESTGIYTLIHGGRYNLEKICTYLYQDATVYLTRKKDKFEKILNLFEERDSLKQEVKLQKDQDVLNLYKEGKSIRQIVKLLNVDSKRVSALLKSNDFVIKIGRTKIK